MDKSRPSPDLLSPVNAIQHLKELLEDGKLEGFEISILQELASRERGVKIDKTGDKNGVCVR